MGQAFKALEDFPSRPQLVRRGSRGRAKIRGVEAYGLGFVSGAVAGRIISVPTNAELGRSAQVGLVVDDPVVAPRHAHVYASQGRFHLIDLNSGVWIDGHRVTPGEPLHLPAGSLVTLGEGGPLAVFDEARLLSRGQRSELVLRREDGPGGSWVINTAVEIGRGSGCGIQLDAQRDSLASSQHVHLLPAFGRLIVTDLGSANGTWSEDVRLIQRALRPGESFVLGGKGGPTFRVETGQDLDSSGLSSSLASSSSNLSSSGVGPPPIPDAFKLELSAGGARGVVHVAAKPEVSFGSFAGLNDFPTLCFPRDLESEEDAMERSDSIGPQHGVLRLTQASVELRDGGDAPTKLDGARLPAGERKVLPSRFTLALGDDSLLFRGRLYRTEGVPPAPAKVGISHQHPVECLVLERMGDAPDSRLFLQLVRQATLGSGDHAAIQVPAAGVAPLHALLYLQQDSLWICQLGRDPVAVDGTPLSSGTALPIGVGSEVYVGTLVLRVRE